jgi:hypothetical protein
MNKIILATAMLCATPFASLALPASAAEALTAAACQPITASNMQECCAAKEWRDIILPSDVRFCPPLNESDRDSGRVGDALAANPDTDPGTGSDPGTDPDTTGSIGGNPGNANPVGGAGEKGMGSSDSPAGTKGNSN